MAETQVVTVAVEKLTKFGFADAEGHYINYSKKCSDEDKLKVVPGVKFDCELYVADSGTRYLNKVFKTLQKADTVKVEKQVVPKITLPKSVVKALVDAPMTRQDWNDKDLRISRQGVIQAAVRAVATFSTAEDLFDNAVLLANQMLTFVNQHTEI